MAGKRKSRSRESLAPSPERAVENKGGPPWILIGGAVGALALIAFLGLNAGSDAPATPEGETAANVSDEMPERPPAPPTPPPEERTPTPPADAAMPPLPLQANLIPRDPEVIRDVYMFAARHPEVLEYVPCFCGCETRGHRRNADCFVRERSADGNVLEWEEHGMACIACVDVGRTAMQLYASGARVTDIRDEIERLYAGSPLHTPTPAPPANAN